MFGRQARMPCEVRLDQTVEPWRSHQDYFENLVSKLEIIHESVRQHVTEYKKKMKAIYDRSAKEPTLEVGDLVWLYYPVVKVGHSRKLAQRWNGPYQIVRKMGPVNFKIRTMDNNPVTKLVHVNRLRRVYDPNKRPVKDLPVNQPIDDEVDGNLGPQEFPSKAFEPDVRVPLPNVEKRITKPVRAKQVADPAQANPDDIYYIDKILGHKWLAKKRYFKIKWQGYKEPTWEIGSNILNQDLIKDYDAKRKAKQKRARRKN